MNTASIGKRIKTVEERLKHIREIPVLIFDSAEEYQSSKLPFGVTDRTVIIIDDISSSEESE